MVEAVEPFTLHPTSMSHIYKVFKHLKQLWMGLWQHTHTVTTTENCLHRILERILFEMWRELPPQNFGADSFWDFGGNRDNIICTKTGINVKQSYLLTYSPRVNFISPGQERRDSVDWDNRPDMTHALRALVTTWLMDLQTAVRSFDQITILQWLFSGQLSFST